MADATDLFKAMNTSALIDAAKYGGYSPIDMNTLTTPKKRSGLGAIMDVGLPMLAAAGMPIAKIGLAGRQAFNLHQYNKQSQQQALYALQQEQLKNKNNASIYKQRTGMDISGPFDTTFANNSAGDIRDDNAKPSLNDHLGGQALRLDAQANYDPALIRQNIEQQGKVANFQNGRAAGLGAIADGQNQSLIRNALMKMSGGPIGGPAMQQGVMDDGNGNVTLNLGASKTGAPQYIQDGMSPFLMPTDVPSGLAGLMKGGLDDAQAKGNLDENKRQYDLGYTLDKAKNAREERELKEKIKGGMFRNDPPGGGSSQNPYTVPNAAQNYVQGQINAIDGELKSLGFVGEGGVIKPVSPNSAPGWFGMGGHQQTPQEQRAQQLIDMRNQLQQQILPVGPAPFRNTAQPKLKNAGKKITGIKGSYEIPE